MGLVLVVVLQLFIVSDLVMNPVIPGFWKLSGLTSWRLIFWAQLERGIIFELQYFIIYIIKRRMFLRYPDPSLCVTSRTIVSRKNFLWYQQKLKAIVDILFFGIILRCGYCPFRFHGCFYCYVMLVENTSKIITTLDRPRDWQKWFEVNILKKKHTL